MGDLAPSSRLAAAVLAIAAKTATAVATSDSSTSDRAGVGAFLVAVFEEVRAEVQRERVGLFVGDLEPHLTSYRGQELVAWLQEPARYDFFVEAVGQAIRTSNRERHRQIASVVAHGLTADSIGVTERAYLLRILGELNDAEVVVLLSYRHAESGNRDAFVTCRPEIFDLDEPFRASTLIPKRQLYEAYVQHLLRLGLLVEVNRITNGRPERTQ
jgi:hypothetical protein